MKPKVFIDGKEGTTGLQIYERLGSRDDIELLLISEEKRKDTEERKKFLNSADIVFLCLPDAAAKEAVSLIENENTRVIDASTCMFPEWTWFVRDMGHLDYPYGSEGMDFLMWLIRMDTQYTIRTSARYPQFMRYDVKEKTLTAQ